MKVLINMTLPDLVGSVQALPEVFTMGIDTEFIDTHTLTVQAAARLAPDTLAVQVYRSPAIPDLGEHFDLQQYLPITPQEYKRFCERILLRPVQLLTPFLSPLRMACDLMGLAGVAVLSRKNGERLRGIFSPYPMDFAPELPDNIRWNARRKSWKVPRIKLTFVGHYLRADFGRLFGWRFLNDLRELSCFGRPLIALNGRKLPGFLEQRGWHRISHPVLEYASHERSFYEVSVEMRDTRLPFGLSSLDRLCRTFLGVGKCDLLSEEEKKNMRAAFHARTNDAYGYAISDAVNTLLIHEQMLAKDREIYESFGVHGSDIPTMAPFPGGRVSTFFQTMTKASLTTGSTQLAKQESLQALMRKGGVSLFDDYPDASKFGRQTGLVHGGLLFNRAPTKLWHEATGKLADVDMSICYLENASRIHVYWGRPVILEPGGRQLTVAQAIAMMQALAPEDGWMLYASGPIRGFPNVLIPSTEDATTNANYRRRHRQKRRAAARQAFQFEAEMDPEGCRGTNGTKLYTAQVEFGVVTQATWLIIQALPPAVRQQYEQLVVDSLLFYPESLIAEDEAHYDELVKKHGSEAIPWETVFDPDEMQLVQHQKIDADYVSLRFPLGEYARKVAQFRKEAQATTGKESGMDLAWKQHGNTFYGVVASSFYPVNNLVAANAITAMARARAFALAQALNGIQLITDGCTYRRDQIPALTYAECLEQQSNYPSHRAEAGGSIPFLDPAEIPMDPEGFTAWYVRHAT